MIELAKYVQTPDFVPIFSAVVAVGALIATCMQARATKMHNQVSIRPVLCDWVHTDSDRIYFWVKNKGLGSAKVTSFCYFDGEERISGKELYKRLEELLLPYEVKMDNFLERLDQGTFFAKDEKVVILDLGFPGCKNIDEIEVILGNRFRLEISYECLYGNKFKYISG
ncbi:hypothetical protein [Pseudoalteromonas sp. R3]|nr:hypothetical protein [Pseudoalteromonas sp. R3]